jgi:hypothetical protein
MAFPPSKKSESKSPKPKQAGGGAPPQPQQGPVPSAPMPMQPPGKPPMPGSGIDPYAALLGGDMGGGMGGPPGGMPPGMPMPMGPMGDSDGDELGAMMAMLGGQGGQAGAMGGGVDPYAVMPGESQYALDGIGPEDPNGGITELMIMLALMQAGVNGTPPQSSSGMMPDPTMSVMGGMGQPPYM